MHWRKQATYSQVVNCFTVLQGAKKWLVKPSLLSLNPFDEVKDITSWPAWQGKNTWRGWVASGPTRVLSLQRPPPHSYTAKKVPIVTPPLVFFLILMIPSEKEDDVTPNSWNVQRKYDPRCHFSEYVVIMELDYWWFLIKYDHNK